MTSALNLTPDLLREWAERHLKDASDKRRKAALLLDEAKVHEAKAADLWRDVNDMEATS